MMKKRKQKLNMLQIILDYKSATFRQNTEQ